MKKIILVLISILFFLIIVTLIITNLLKSSSKKENNTAYVPISTSPNNYSGSSATQNNNRQQAVNSTNNANDNLSSPTNLNHQTNSSNETNKTITGSNSTNPLTTDSSPSTESKQQSIGQNQPEGGNLPSDQELTKNSSVNNTSNNDEIPSQTTNINSDKNDESAKSKSNDQNSDSILGQATSELNIILDKLFINSHLLIPTPTTTLSKDVNPTEEVATSNKKNKKTTSTPKNKKNQNISTAKTYNGLVYYSQCGGGYDSYPLPDGCTVCYAGCGSTSVAMLLSSFVDKKFTPSYVADLYKQNGQSLGCGGSYYSSAKIILQKYGLTTTDYITYGLADADQVAADFKKYLDAGWVIFTLANYRENGGGHFFIVTGVENGSIMAFDPYYGRSQTPPINENKYDPFPKYRVAFGVKTKL